MWTASVCVGPDLVLPSSRALTLTPQVYPGIGSYRWVQMLVWVGVMRFLPPAVPFEARKAVHAASVGRRMVELLGTPTIGSVAFTSPALVCRSVTLAMPATNCCAVH